MVDNVNIMAKPVDKVNRQVAAAPEAPPPDAEVGEKLHALVHAMRRQLQQALRNHPDDVTPMEWRALGFFARRPGACARDLVEHAGRDKAQVARLVRTLIGRGLLVASSAPQDQRVQQLHLSATGRREAQRMQLLREKIDRRMLATLDEQERRHLSALLDRLLASLNET
jgi:DNA-binding MarR family transcriptional regulator